MLNNSTETTNWIGQNTRTVDRPTNESNSERDLLFLPLWRNNQHVVNMVLWKYRFITVDEREDYRQEIFISAWRYFHHWLRRKQEGITWQQWLSVNARRAVCTCRARMIHVGLRDHRRLYERKIFYVDDVLPYQGADSVYDEDHFGSLEAAIMQLPTDDRKVVQMFIEGRDFQKESISIGKSPHYYSGRFFAIKNRIRKHHKMYFEDIRVLVDKKPQVSRGENHSGSKPVMQLDQEGNIIKIWPSTMEAARNGFIAPLISSAARGKIKHHAGFLWKYVALNDHPETHN